MLERVAGYLLGIAIAVDILANALLGGEHYTTISCRIGESIEAGGWAARVPWPGFLRRHFIGSVFEEVV